MLKTLPRMAAERLVWVLVVGGVGCSSPTAQSVDVEADALADVDQADSPTAQSNDAASDALADIDHVDKTIALDTLPEAFAVLVCRAQLGMANSWMAVDECLQFADNYSSKAIRDRVALAKAGRVTYDPLAAAACVAADDGKNTQEIAYILSGWKAPQAGAPPVPASCLKVFVGTQQIGADCDDDAECATGRCWGCPTGICTEGVTLGNECGRNVPCAEGLCFMGTCQTDVALPLGATCVDVVHATSWTPSNDIWFTQITCQSPWVCLDAGNGLGKCSVGQPAGAVCGQQVCAAGLYCMSGHCSTPAAQVVKCGNNACKLDETCDQTSQKCQQWALPGADCSNGEPCAQSTCDAASHKCLVDNPCGATCQPMQCVKGKGCQLNKLGDSCVDKCNDDDLRATSLLCVKGVCRRKDNPACTFPPTAP